MQRSNRKIECDKLLIALSCIITLTGCNNSDDRAQNIEQMAEPMTVPVQQNPVNSIRVKIEHCTRNTDSVYYNTCHVTMNNDTDYPLHGLSIESGGVEYMFLDPSAIFVLHAHDSFEQDRVDIANDFLAGTKFHVKECELQTIAEGECQRMVQIDYTRPTSTAEK